jgi:uncharacterized protein (TIGR03084 family)
MSDHDLVLESLAAFVLDACEPDEARAIEEHLAGCTDCRSQAGRLREAAGWLAGTTAAEPPAGLRGRILTSPPPRDELSPPVAAYVAETRRLDALLEGLTAAQWGTATVAEGWSAHELVAHLLATDSLVLSWLGGPAPIPEREPTVLDRTGAVQTRHRTRTPETTVAEWRHVRDLLVGTAVRADLTMELNWFGLPVPAAGMMVIRAFETWTHADDIRMALGRPIEPPGEPALTVMTDLLCQSMPIALRLREVEPGPVSARIILTGPGGGRWDVGLGEGADPAHPDVVLTTDSISWCRLGADRLRPDEVVSVVDGDVALAQALLDAAPAFAVP